MIKLSFKGKKNNFIKKKSTRFTAADALYSRRKEPGWEPVKIDPKLAIITVAFVFFGLIFTYSSSAFDTTAFFKRQIVFNILGLAAALGLAQFYTPLQKIVKPIWLMYATWALLIIVLFTKPIANVHRWIDLGVVKVQPSELAKVTLVIYIASYLSNVSGKLAKNWKLLINPLVVSGVTFVLLMREPDLGTPMLMGGVLVAMLFVAGASWKHLAALFALSLPVVLYQLIFYTYRLKRLFSFLNPEAQAAGDGYQLFQSFLAVGSGGWFGKGLGNSELKLEYLPAAHTDFIFSIMCEEIGLIGVLIILIVFCCLMVRGISLARVSKNNFNSLAIFGLTITVCMQAFFNMAMAIGLLPTKGIALPFFSYGGSSVIMTLVTMGIISNLAADAAPKRRPDDFTNYKNRNK